KQRQFWSRRHPPSDAVACDYGLVAGFLARGLSSLHHLPRNRIPSGVHGRDSPPTVAGAATALCIEAHAPRSPSAPFRDPRTQSWHLSLMKVKEVVIPTTDNSFRCVLRTPHRPVPFDAWS